jgi:hypothetical protein
MGEFPEGFMVFLFPKMKILIEHFFPGERMDDGGFGDHAIHIKNYRVKIQHIFTFQSPLIPVSTRLWNQPEHELHSTFIPYSLAIVLVSRPGYCANNGQNWEDDSVAVNAETSFRSGVPLQTIIAWIANGIG